MWSIGSIRIKHNDNVFTSDPYDKDFYTMYDGEYLRVGDFYITEDLPRTMDPDDTRFITFSKKCFISMGAPYKSSNSEVLDRAIELYYFINYDQTGVKMNLHKDDIISLFDMSSLHIIPRHGEQQIMKLWTDLTDRTKIHILTTIVTMTYKNNLYRHIYERLKIGEIEQGLLTGTHIIKVLPIKYDKEINMNDYRDVFFNRVLYPEDKMDEDRIFVYPNVQQVGLLGGLSAKFYSKFNMSIYSANTKTGLAIIMNKMPFNVFMFIRDILYPKYSEKVHYTEVNNILYKALKSLLYVHRNGMYHGDFHTGNLTIGEKHKLYSLPDFTEGFILANKYNINPIDFGESFLFTEHTHILMLIKKILPDLYGRYVEEIKNKYKKHRDEFIIASTCVDIIEVLTSFRDTVKYVLEFHSLKKTEQQKKIFKRLKELINWIVSKYTEYLKSDISIYDIFAEENAMLLGGGSVPKFISNKNIELEKSVMYAGDYSRLPIYQCLRIFFPLNYKPNLE